MRVDEAVKREVLASLTWQQQFHIWRCLAGGARPVPLKETAQRIGIAQAHLSRCLDAESPPSYGKLSDFLAEVGIVMGSAEGSD